METVYLFILGVCLHLKDLFLNQGFYKTATSEFLDSFQRHCQSEINLKVFFNTSLGIIELIRPQNFPRN